MPCESRPGTAATTTVTSTADTTRIRRGSHHSIPERGCYGSYHCLRTPANRTTVNSASLAQGAMQYRTQQVPLSRVLLGTVAEAAASRMYTCRSHLGIHDNHHDSLRIGYLATRHGSCLVPTQRRVFSCPQVTTLPYAFSAVYSKLSLKGSRSVYTALTALFSTPVLTDSS